MDVIFRCILAVAAYFAWEITLHHRLKAACGALRRAVDGDRRILELCTGKGNWAVEFKAMLWSIFRKEPVSAGEVKQRLLATEDQLDEIDRLLRGQSALASKSAVCFGLAMLCNPPACCVFVGIYLFFYYLFVRE